MKSWAKQSDVIVIPTGAPQWGAEWTDPSTRMTSLGMTADGQIAAPTTPLGSGLAMTQELDSINSIFGLIISDLCDFTRRPAAEPSRLFPPLGRW